MWKIRTQKRALLGTILGAAVLTALPISPNWLPTKTLSLSLDKANAVIGRPLTPLSVAGVHRRAARRAYYGGGYGYGRGYGYGAAAAIGTGAAYYGLNRPAYAYGYGNSPYYGGGYSNLYNYYPAA